MHKHQRRTLTCYHRSERRIKPKSTNIVNDARAVGNRLSSNLALVSINRDRNSKAAVELAQHRQHTGKLLFSRHSRGTWSGRLATDFDDISAFGLQLEGSIDSSSNIEMKPTIRERIRSDIQDTNDDGPITKYDRTAIPQVYDELLSHSNE